MPNTLNTIAVARAIGREHFPGRSIFIGYAAADRDAQSRFGGAITGPLSLQGQVEKFVDSLKSQGYSAVLRPTTPSPQSFQERVAADKARRRTTEQGGILPAPQRQVGHQRRDQSEDRPQARFVVVYLDQGTDRAFSGRPWKVYDRKHNPSFRGAIGRYSFSNATAATKYAIQREAAAS